MQLYMLQICYYFAGKIINTHGEGPGKLRLVQEARLHIVTLRNHITEYQESIQQQHNAVFWLQFIKMADIHNASSFTSVKVTGRVTSLSRARCSPS